MASTENDTAADHAQGDTSPEVGTGPQEGAERHEGPGTAAPPGAAGLVDTGEGDVSERPQGDPEVPELGAWDKARGQLPDTDATGF